MSQLDGYFANRATRGLAVYSETVPGESDLEPGYVYPVAGADQSAIFGIAAHPIAEVSGKRIALKIVSAAETPPGGALSMIAPEGQQVEGDDGMLAHNAALGAQALGVYREWVCDPDGNWLLVRSVGSAEVPTGVEGQIVIRGVPVVIRGVPLVNTTPPTTVLAPSTPTVLPAVIVPRVPLAPRAPTTIELEDAFADASLEMNETGELFRVATVRYPVTLRTTSLDSLDFVEIGIVRLDAAQYGAAWTLIAELEVSNAGQQVELQLYNLTTPAVVATLSSSSLVTEKRSAAITLPLSEALYSVRLRRVLGAEGQLVSCRSVTLER